MGKSDLSVSLDLFLKAQARRMSAQEKFDEAQKAKDLAVDRYCDEVGAFKTEFIAAGGVEIHIDARASNPEDCPQRIVRKRKNLAVGRETTIFKKDHPQIDQLVRYEHNPEVCLDLFVELGVLSLDEKLVYFSGTFSWYEKTAGGWQKLASDIIL